MSIRVEFPALRAALTDLRYSPVKIPLEGDDHENPVVDSLSTLWPTAGFHEREVYDLFGIRFSGHTDMRRLFMEEGYGFPLRKDFSDESRVLNLS